MKNKATHIIKDSLEDKKKLQEFLNVVKDKPLFQDKIDAIEAMLKTSNFANPVSE